MIKSPVKLKLNSVPVRNSNIRSHLLDSGNFSLVREKDRAVLIMLSQNGATLWSLINGNRDIRKILLNMNERITESELKLIIQFFIDKKLIKIKTS